MVFITSFEKCFELIIDSAQTEGRRQGELHVKVSIKVFAVQTVAIRTICSAIASMLYLGKKNLVLEVCNDT